jgi:CheY-like chemotaxis protein
MSGRVALFGAPAPLAQLRAKPYDIIFCDWEMEPMNGLSVLHHVRRSPETAAIPFILMPAKKEPRWVLQATQAGANCLVSKPFDADTLRAKIGQLAQRTNAPDRCLKQQCFSASLPHGRAARSPL